MLVHSPKELALAVIGQRKKLQLSQSEVADLVGLQQKTISAFENKPESTEIKTLFLILSAVNLDLNISKKGKIDRTEGPWIEEW